MLTYRRIKEPVHAEYHTYRQYFNTTQELSRLLVEYANIPTNSYREFKHLAYELSYVYNSAYSEVAEPVFYVQTYHDARRGRTWHGICNWLITEMTEQI